jgi:hypothetical protein
MKLFARSTSNHFKDIDNEKSVDNILCDILNRTAGRFRDGW